MDERSRARQQARGARLQHQAAAYREARTKLKDLYDDGGRGAATVALRRAFVHQRAPVSFFGIEFEEGAPSPAASLVTAKGVAMALYLIAIFDAQCRRPSGSPVRNNRPLRGSKDSAGWVDLLPATTDTTSVWVGMRRQLTRALTTLDERGLVELLGQAGTADRYEGFQLLDESASDDSAPYEVPVRRADIDSHYRLSPDARRMMSPVFEIPVDFFLQGWVHVLSSAEIATYLMLSDLQAQFPRANSGVFLTEPRREAMYGLSRDVYESHRALRSYGLVQLLSNPNRHDNGKIRRRPGGGQMLQPHRFRILPQGLQRPALLAVTEALTAGTNAG